MAIPIQDHVDSTAETWRSSAQVPRFFTANGSSTCSCEWKLQQSDITVDRRSVNGSTASNGVERHCLEDLKLTAAQHPRQQRLQNTRKISAIATGSSGYIRGACTESMHVRSFGVITRKPPETRVHFHEPPRRTARVPANRRCCLRTLNFSSLGESMHRDTHIRGASCPRSICLGK